MSNTPATTAPPTGPIGQAVALQDDQNMGKFVAAYEGKLEKVLPSHMHAEQWVRVAAAALKRGPIDQRTGKYELELAAQNDPAVFMAYLLDAARQGLEPGTEQYYLTPRWNGKKQHIEILGITGYQGYIEMMYRAGAVASVVAEIVYSNDTFDYQPGRDRVPVHRIDWDADERGEMRLVYAYAIMRDGSPSKVIVLNRAHVEKVRDEVRGSDKAQSPWRKWPESMWLKTAIRQLRKWVPTSAEYIMTGGATAGAQLAVASMPAQPGGAQVTGAPALAELPAAASPSAPGPDDDLDGIPTVNPETGEIDGHDVGDDDDDQADGGAVDTTGRPPAPSEGFTPRTSQQSKALHALLKSKYNATGDARFPVLSGLLDRDVSSTNDISIDECGWLIDTMQGVDDWTDGEQQGLLS